MAGAPRPVTDEERQEVARLHGEGMSRNDIARTMGRSGYTISTIAKDLGLSFERGPEVIAATKARQTDLAALRSQLALDLTYDAMRLRGQVWEPATIYAFGGKDNTYAEESVPEPPALDKKTLMTAAGIAIDRSLKLAPLETDAQGLAAVDEWLRGMLGD